jgi:general secretion pathway protein N
LRPLTLAALGAAAYAVFLVALMPAGYVAAKLEASTRGGVQVHEARGSIWRGAGRATIATPAGPLAVENLEWRFLPARLIAGRLAFAVTGRSAGFESRGEMARSFSRWEARDVAIDGLAAGAASFLPLIAHWRPEGRLAAKAAFFGWNDREMHGEARIEWRAAAVALSEVRPLGSYRVDLRGDGAQARVTLSTIEGPLALAGQGTIAPPARLAFSGEARAQGTAAAGLQPLLDLMGPRRADGSRTLQWRLN